MNISSYRSTMAIALVSCLAIACGDDTDRPGRETPGQTPDGSTGLDGSEPSQDPDGGHDDEDAGTHDHEDAGDAGGPEDGGNTEEPSTEACPANTEGCACTPVPDRLAQGSCKEGMICVDWGAIGGYESKDLSQTGPFATCVKPCTEDSQCESPEMEKRVCSSINLAAHLKDDDAQPFEAIKKICTDRAVKSGEVCGMSRNIQSWTKDRKGTPNTSITQRSMVGCEGNGSCIAMFPDKNPDESFCFDFCADKSECGGDTPECAITWFTSKQLKRRNICGTSVKAKGDLCLDVWQGRSYIDGCAGESVHCLPMMPEVLAQIGGAAGGVCADFAREARGTEPAIPCPEGTVEDSTTFTSLCSDNCTRAPDSCQAKDDGTPRTCVDWTFLNSLPEGGQQGSNYKASVCAVKKVVEPPMQRTVMKLGSGGLEPDGEADPRCYAVEHGFTACPEGTSCIFWGRAQGGLFGLCQPTCDTGKRLDPATGNTVTTTLATACPEGLMCYGQKVAHRPDLGLCITSTLTE